MVVRVLLGCCTFVGCLGNQQREIAGTDKSSNTLGSNNYETVYGLDVSNDRQEVCGNKDTVKVTVAIKADQRIATKGDGAKAKIELFDDGNLIATKNAKQGRAVFTLDSNDFEPDEYHYLDVTAKIKGRPDVLTALTEGFVFIKDCEEEL